MGPVEAARAMGVDPGAYTRWEGGLQDPGLRGVPKAAAFYGVSGAWLAWGEGKSGIKLDAVSATFERAAREMEEMKKKAQPVGRAARRKDG